MGSRERRTTIGEQFAPRTIRMLRSPAWCALSLSARRVLDRIEIELADHGGIDNGKLPVTFADFGRYGMDRHAIGPAIREAVALGFLEVTEPGRAGNAEFRKPNLFRLTYRNTRHGAPTNEWEKIGADQVEAIARAARSEPSKTSGGKRHVSVRETPTETGPAPVGETHTTGQGGETPTTLDISGRGGNTPLRAIGKATL